MDRYRNYRFCPSCQRDVYTTTSLRGRVCENCGMSAGRMKPPLVLGKMFCPVCQANRGVKRRVRWGIFILLCFVGVAAGVGIGLGLLYLVYCVLFKRRKCEVCGLDQKRMEPPRDVFECAPPIDGFGGYEGDGQRFGKRDGRR